MRLQHFGKEMRCANCGAGSSQRNPRLYTAPAGSLSLYANARSIAPDDHVPELVQAGARYRSIAMRRYLVIAEAKAPSGIRVAYFHDDERDTESNERQLRGSCTAALGQASNSIYAPLAAETCLTKDREALLAFYDFPAEHWDHLRTGNPIESVFATVRHRTVRTKGALSQKTATLMVFMLVQAAAKTWRRLKGANQLPMVIEGVTFTDGVAASDAETRAA